MAKDKIPAGHIYYTINPITWFKVLKENKGVSRSKIFEAIKITFFSLLSTPFQILDRIVFWYKTRSITVHDEPLFIIGHWRSGTTYLHYLLAKDESFGFLSVYQAFIPNITTIGGNLFKSIFTPLVPHKRPQDNIEVSIDIPAEEENAISTFALESASHSWWFPQNEKYFNKYGLFNDVTDNDRKGWRKAYQRMMGKISLAHPGKRILIKNPHNTGRIKELLTLYPKAKFIHIYRNPLSVIPSTYLMYNKVVTTQFLQDYSEAELHDKIFYYYKSSMSKMLIEKELIPKENLYDLRFEEFEKDPLSQLEAIYEKFGYDTFDKAFPAMRDYVKAKKNYKKNNHKESPIDKDRIYEDCKFAFQALGYPLAKTSSLNPQPVHKSKSHIKAGYK